VLPLLLLLLLVLLLVVVVWPLMLDDTPLS